jgi:transposase
VNEIQRLRREGLTISAIGRLTGFNRKTIRKHLRAGGIPRYGPRAARPSKLDVFKEYLEGRLGAGVWNAVVLLRELKERGYRGGYTILKEYLQPRRRAAKEVAVRRFETPPGEQAQLDWGHLGYLEQAEGKRQSVWGFVLTLGWSRAMVAEIALDQRLETLLALHEEAFRQLGGVPREILYDRMKTVLVDIDDRGEIRWHPVFRDFCHWWGFAPRLCHAYRPQTKGKVESGIKYLKGNFVCGWQGSDFASVPSGLRRWCWEVANQRVHGTTGRVISEALAQEQPHLLPILGRRAYPFVPGVHRKVARDAYVQWETNRYSVPWQLAGSPIQVHARHGSLDLYAGGARVAVHSQHAGRHQRITDPAHHRGMPFVAQGPPASRKLHLQLGAPEVEVRSLASYELWEEAEQP